MKKVLFGLFALSSIAFANTNLYLRTGIDFNGKYEEINLGEGALHKKDSDGTGYEFAIEVTKNIDKNIELGVGIAYQDHGKIDGKKVFEYEDKDNSYYTEFNFDDYQSVPVYLTGKLTIPTKYNIKPYLKMDLGYSFNFGLNNLSTYNEDKENGVMDKYTDSVSLDLENGLYFGFGTGLEYNNFTVDLMYKLNKADVKYSDLDVGVTKPIDYSRVTLSFGYKFDL